MRISNISNTSFKGIMEVTGTDQEISQVNEIVSREARLNKMESLLNSKEPIRYACVSDTGKTAFLNKGKKTTILATGNEAQDLNMSVFFAGIQSGDIKIGNRTETVKNIDERAFIDSFLNGIQDLRDKAQKIDAKDFLEKYSKRKFNFPKMLMRK